MQTAEDLRSIVGSIPYRLALAGGWIDQPRFNSFERGCGRHWWILHLPDRIDGPIVLSLTFMLWFCVPQLIVLASAPGR